MGFFSAYEKIIFMENDLYTIITGLLYRDFSLFWLTSRHCVMLKYFYLNLSLWNPVIYFYVDLASFYPETSRPILCKYEGWNFNSGNYLFTTDTK